MVRAKLLVPYSFRVSQLVTEYPEQRSTSGSGVMSFARGGVTGGVTSSVTGRYWSATRLAGCDAGGAEEARGRGSSNAGLGREVCDEDTARGVEVRAVSAAKRLTGGGSSLTKSKSQRTVWGGPRARGGGAWFSSLFSMSVLIMSMIVFLLGIAKYLSYGSYFGSELPGCSPC